MAPLPDNHLLFDPSTLGVKSSARRAERVGKLWLDGDTILHVDGGFAYSDVRSVAEGDRVTYEGSEGISVTPTKHQERHAALERVYLNLESVRSQAEATLKLAGVSVPTDADPSHRSA